MTGHLDEAAAGQLAFALDAAQASRNAACAPPAAPGDRPPPGRPVRPLRGPERVTGRMTDPPIRTAAAHAGVLAGCQAGQRLLLHDLHAAVTEYDRLARDDCATRAWQISLLEPLFNRGDLPIFEVATPAELAAYREACGRARDASLAREHAERHLRDVLVEVGMGPAIALQRAAERQGCTS